MRKAGIIITVMGLIILLTLSISYSEGMGKKSDEDQGDTTAQVENVKPEADTIKNQEEELKNLLKQDRNNIKLLEKLANVNMDQGDLEESVKYWKAYNEKKRKENERFNDSQKRIFTALIQEYQKKISKIEESATSVGAYKDIIMLNEKILKMNLKMEALDKATICYEKLKTYKHKYATLKQERKLEKEKMFDEHRNDIDKNQVAIYIEKEEKISYKKSKNMKKSKKAEKKYSIYDKENSVLNHYVSCDDFTVESTVAPDNVKPSIKIKNHKTGEKIDVSLLSKIPSKDVMTSMVLTDISENGEYIACSVYGYLFLLNNNGKILWQKEFDNDGSERTLAVSSDNKYIAAIVDYSSLGKKNYNHIFLYTIDGELLWDKQVIPTALYKLKFSDDSTYVSVSLNDYNGFYIFNTENGDLLWATLDKKEHSRIDSVFISSEAKYILLAKTFFKSGFKRIELFNLGQHLLWADDIYDSGIDRNYPKLSFDVNTMQIIAEFEDETLIYTVENKGQ